MTDIGGKDWHVGQPVILTLPDGSRRGGHITRIVPNRRNGDVTAYLDNHFSFMASDIEFNLVEACLEDSVSA